MTIKAINPAHQKAVDSFIKADKAYSTRIDYLHANDLDDGEDIKANKLYSRAFDYFDALPKREQLNISKSGYCVAGY